MFRQLSTGYITKLLILWIKSYDGQHAIRPAMAGRIACWPSYATAAATVV